jgi:hypothetical protein
LTLRDGTNMISRNAGNQLPTYSMQHFSPGVKSLSSILYKNRIHMYSRAGILIWRLPLSFNISCLRGQQFLILSQAKCQSHTNVNCQRCCKCHSTFKLPQTHSLKNVQANSTSTTLTLKHRKTLRQQTPVNVMATKKIFFYRHWCPS